MKRTLIIVSLIFAISISLLAGTLSMYTVSIDKLAEGSVVAKEFIFVSEGMESFELGAKIAPTEKVQWQFNVKNHENGLITETDMYYKLTFNVEATEGKTAIEPLIIKVNGKEMKTVNGVGRFDVYGKFPLAEVGQDKEYTVEMYWPNGDNDIDYAGDNFGTSIKVDALAQQLPFDGQAPEEPEEPEIGDIVVEYRTHADGDNAFHYYFTISNKTNQTIENWQMTFSLPRDRITELFGDARMYDPLGGSYRFYHAPYYLVNIEPGQSLTFDGKGIGDGLEAIENVKVNGKPVKLSTSLR